MYGLAARDKPRVTRLSQGFQENITSLNKSQTLSQNISKFSRKPSLTRLAQVYT